MRRQESQRRQCVRLLFIATAIASLAPSDASKVEPQRGDVSLCQGVAQGEDHIVVHASAVLGMRVANYNAGAPLLAAGPVEHAFQREAAACVAGAEEDPFFGQPTPPSSGISYAS